MKLDRDSEDFEPIDSGDIHRHMVDISAQAIEMFWARIDKYMILMKQSVESYVDSVVYVIKDEIDMEAYDQLIDNVDIFGKVEFEASLKFAVPGLAVLKTPRDDELTFY